MKGAGCIGAGFIRGALILSVLACGAGRVDPNSARDSVILAATVVDPSRAPVANVSMRLMIVNKIADPAPAAAIIRQCSFCSLPPQRRGT